MAISSPSPQKSSFCPVWAIVPAYSAQPAWAASSGATGQPQAPVALATFNLTHMGWPELAGGLAYSVALSVNSTNSASVVWLFSAPEGASAAAAPVGRPNGGVLTVHSLAVAPAAGASWAAVNASTVVGVGAPATSVPALRLSGRAAAPDERSGIAPVALDNTLGLLAAADEGIAPFASLPPLRAMASGSGVAAVFTVTGSTPLLLRNVTILARLASPLPWVRSTTPTAPDMFDYDVTLQAWL